MLDSLAIGIKYLALYISSIANASLITHGSFETLVFTDNSTAQGKVI
ncbi:hypothetical protein CPS_1412 [Colwellia psychrerythraea 34H]|uniref:Uncharacterized protein n=1 Tax=Colwellia psychrerythraea (strain 34H / ATCC BAA-681) TaxID=167879 RepID=Q485W0_COLP3|nr:hypothetical protein CPS_1412 [Colwellia psychrerythraea 34H]